MLAVCPDAAESFFDPFPRHVAVGGEIKQSLFLHIKLLELLAVVVVEFLHRGTFVGQCRVDLLSEDGREVSVQCQVRIQIDDGLLHYVHGQVRQVAQFVLTSPAEVVLVAVTAPSLGLGVDHPTGASGLVTAVAEQHALEVVMMHPVTLASGTPGFHDFLDLVEQLLADDGGMTTLEGIPFVDNKTQVVRVLQHAVQLTGSERLRRAAAAGPGGQPLIGHSGVEPVDRVLTGRIQLPSHPNEGRPLFVQSDRVDESAVVFHPNVLVANTRPANSAAVLGFVLHLDPDVFTAHPDLDFVNNVRDRFHGVSHDAVTKVFLGADEPDAQLL